MDAIVKQETRFLPALADAIADWFPELGRRSLAVSECTITKENVPTLPLVVVAFIRASASPPTNQRNDMFSITDTFVVEFWLEPARYKKANGTETPFWSYYDYERIRDVLLTNITYWEGPGGERIAFRRLSINAEPLAVTLTFAFDATFRWCPSTKPHGEPFQIGYNLCTPVGCCPDVICEEPDPCQ
jgi:hypothetical protein